VAAKDVVKRFVKAVLAKHHPDLFSKSQEAYSRVVHKATNKVVSDYEAKPRKEKPQQWLDEKRKSKSASCNLIFFFKLICWHFLHRTKDLIEKYIKVRAATLKSTPSNT
jgi:hypothetical protein